jgi:hypothetical protein
MTGLEMTVNLADPHEVRSKMPEIEGLLAAARRQLADVEAQVDLLERIVGQPRSSSHGPSLAASGKRTRGKTRRKVRAAPSKAPAQEQAVKAIELAGHPMGPAELFRFMQEQKLPGPNSVERLGSILWAAAGAGRLTRMDGKYTPIGGFPDRSESALAAPNGQMAVSPPLPGPNGFGSPTAAPQASPQTQIPPGSAGT